LICRKFLLLGIIPWWDATSGRLTAQMTPERMGFAQEFFVLETEGDRDSDERYFEGDRHEHTDDEA
jgi:hypothetical protein